MSRERDLQALCPVEYEIGIYEAFEYVFFFPSLPTTVPSNFFHQSRKSGLHFCYSFDFIRSLHVNLSNN